jgi:YegS/Rv2252/BmrU family lipid kinase
VAAGGDGTINEVLNGLLVGDRLRDPRVELGFVGLGTGRDLGRTLGVPADPHEQLVALAAGRTRRVDVGRIRYQGDAGPSTRYYVNVASFGLGGVTDRIMNGHALRWLPARLAFQAAVAQAVMVYRNAAVTLQTDREPPRRAVVKVVAICNGQHFGGGMRIAPHAAMDDGLLDCVTIGDIGLLTLVRRLGTVYRGEHLTLPEVAWSRAGQVVAEPVDPSAAVYLDIDGEPEGRLPATFDVLPGVLPLRF